MPKVIWTFCVMMAASGCSGNLQASHSPPPDEFADVTIMSQDHVVSHVVYRNDSTLNEFSCRLDPQGPAVEFIARRMIAQPDGHQLPQEMQLFFPLIPDSGKAVQQEWSAGDRKVELYGRLAEPEYLNAHLDGDLQGSCLADIARSGTSLSGHMVCTHFERTGSGELGAFDLQVSRFSCIIR